MAASSSAREAAYQTLWNRIVTMELKPGDPLNDRQLAEEMGISRTPVREALIMLNIAHMVVIKPQSGTYVAPMDLKLMRLEQFARFTLEKEMLLQVYDHCQPAYIEAYQANFCGMEDHFDHMISTFKHIERLRLFSLMLGENESVPSQHRRIVEALEHGTAGQLAQALREHLDRYKLSVQQARKAHPDYFIEG